MSYEQVNSTKTHLLLAASEFDEAVTFLVNEQTTRDALVTLATQAPYAVTAERTVGFLI